MKKIAALLLSVVMMLSLPEHAFATEKPKTKISTVKQKGDDVIFTLTSSKQFYFGNSEYTLFIGKKTFKESRDLSHDNKGIMNFYIPKEDYNMLIEGVNIYLTYGRIGSDEENEDQLLDELNKQGNRRIWYLGKFSKKMLTK